jgi:uncharacterized membrane protein HdeD (DUF308 family)
LSGFYFGFGWFPHFGDVLRGLAEPAAASTILVVGASCAWVSWRQRKAATVRRAAFQGALWGIGIGTLGALVGCVAAGMPPSSLPILGCWAAMSMLMAPYVAIWLAGFCAWQRWRSGYLTQATER